MGSKFCNLNVYGADLATVEAFCSGYSVKELAPTWITVAGENIAWGAAQKIAKVLSMSLSSPVLSTEFFDDDYVEFALYREGKRVARHVPAEYEGLARAPGKSKAWGEQLALSPEKEKALQIVFRETNPERSLHLLECLIGCPLWVSAESMDEAIIPDLDYLSEYLTQKKAESKIKNQTKLLLLDEVPGDFGWHLTYPVVQDQHTDDMKLFLDIKEGHFRPLFEKQVSGRTGNFLAYARGEDAFLLTFMQVGTEEHKVVAYIFSDQGEVLEEISEEEQSYLKGTFLDKDRVLLEDSCWNIRTHNKEWDMGLNKLAHGIYPPCLFPDGRRAIVCDTTGKVPNSFLVSFRPDGTDQIVLKLPTVQHWAYPLVSGPDLYLGCGKQLACYNESLEEQWSMNLQEEVVQMGTPYLDVEAQMLYMSIYGSITALDLKSRKIVATRKVAKGEDCYLYGILPGVGLIMQTGNSSIEVWNLDLVPISRHRVKGTIEQIVYQEDRVYLLTNASEDRTLQNTGTGWEFALLKQGWLRLYELKQ